LHQARNGCAKVAEILNQETWRPAKRRDTFNAQMVRQLLTAADAIEPAQRRERMLPGRRPDEWTIRELTEKLGIPQATTGSRTDVYPAARSKPAPALRSWSPPTRRRLPT
jgi:hypothetical protein